MNILLRKKIDRWLEANIIDSEAHARILKFEESKFSLTGNHFILGLGTVSIAVGIISIVAANWYVLTKDIKIISNILLLIFLTFMTYTSEKKNNKTLLEIFSTLYFISIIATFALMGQIYNITNDIFITLSYWLILGTPLILLTRTKYVANFYSFIIFIWIIAGINYFSENSFRDSSLFIFVPATLLYASLIFKKINRDHIYKACKNLSNFSLSILFLIIAPILWKSMPYASTEMNTKNLIIPLIVVLPLFYHILKKHSNEWLFIAVSIFLFIQAPVVFPIGEQKELGALFFILIWSCIAYLSYKNKNQKLFDTSFLIISLRIIVIYFEVFGSLLDTGIGLITSGCFLIGMFYFWKSNRKTLWKRLVKNEK